MLLCTPFVPSLCPVCKEVWVDVCGGSDPSQQTMSRLKRGFLLFSLRSPLVRCKFTWPFNSSPHKLLRSVQRLLFGHIRRHCCLGHSSGMLSSGVYVRRPFLNGSVSWRIMWKTPGHNNNTVWQEYISACHLSKPKISIWGKMPLMCGTTVHWLVINERGKKNN